MATSVTVCRAEESDLDDVIAMIQELADFEKMPNGPQLTKDDLLRDGGYSQDNKTPLFYCFVAKQELSGQTSCSIVGYALCFFSYSTWRGKALFMEDLYVRPASRKLGAGRRLMQHVAQFAKSEDCQRLDFHVLRWNPARNFYDKMGAHDLTESEEWLLYRMDRSEIDNI